MNPIEAYYHLFDSFSNYKLRCNSEWTNKDIEAFNAIDECITKWRKMQEIQDKYSWHDLRGNPEDLPPTEVEVDIAYEVNVCNGLKFINTARAFYEDGTITSEDSSKMCYDFDYCEAWDYDEETDSYIISKGWYEAVKFTENAVVIGTPIIAWRYIEPFEFKT